MPAGNMRIHKKNGKVTKAERQDVKKKWHQIANRHLQLWVIHVYETQQSTHKIKKHMGL